MKPSLVALATDGSEGKRLCAPGVGRYLHAPPVGTHVAPGAPAGCLRVLRRTFDLVVPAGGGGVVREVLVSGRIPVVEYGQPLLVLGLTAEGLTTDPGAEAEAQAGEALPEGALAVRAPTDGIFYRRPSPDQPEYVAEGEVISRGKVLGLVEVMKCFNQIAYGGEALPERARVTRILPEDGDEVRSGQILFVVEPAAGAGT